MPLKCRRQSPNNDQNGIELKAGDQLTPNGDEISTVGLKKSIGLLNGITIIIGVIIGSGIFISPTGILSNVRSVGASLVIWVACGLFSLLGAYCYAELGTMLQRSGGDYIYVYDAFGPFLGFLRLWVEVMVARPVSISILAITFAEYIVDPFFPDCEKPRSVLILLATCCIIIVSFINSFSVRLSTRVQDVFTYVKLFALALIIITGFVQIGLGNYENLQDTFSGSNWSPGSITNAFYAGLFAYSGWNYLNCMIEEMYNPKRDLPIAVVVSCLVVTAIYTLANVAYVTTVAPSEILTTPAVAITFSRRVYGVMWWIMPIFVAFSTFGGVNGSILTTSRIFFIASQVNQMPNFICFLHMNRSTPIPAVIFTCVISIVYLFTGSVSALINYLGFVQWLAIGLCVLIVVVFRFTKKDAPRPVKAPIVFAVVYLLVTAFLLVFTFVSSPIEAILGCVIIVTGIPVYVIGCVWENKPRAFKQKFDQLTLIVQKSLRVVPTN